MKVKIVTLHKPYTLLGKYDTIDTLELYNTDFIDLPFGELTGTDLYPYLSYIGQVRVHSVYEPYELAKCKLFICGDNEEFTIKDKSSLIGFMNKLRDTSKYNLNDFDINKKSKQIIDGLKQYPKLIDAIKVKFNEITKDDLIDEPIDKLIDKSKVIYKNFETLHPKLYENEKVNNCLKSFKNNINDLEKLFVKINNKN